MKKFDKRTIITYVLFTLLLGISCAFNQLLVPVFDCGTSPYGEFKQAHCDKDNVEFYGRDFVTLPTSLIRTAAIEYLPIYDDSNIVWMFGFLYVMTPVAPLGAIQIETFSQEPESIMTQLAEIIFLLLDIAYVLAVAAGLTYLWQKKTKAARVAVMLILLIVFKYHLLITLPFFLFVLNKG